MGIQLLRQDGGPPDLKAVAAWAKGQYGFKKPEPLGDGLVWVYHNPETGCRFDLVLEPGLGLRLELPLPQALVLAKEILRALEELAGRFGLVPPAEVRFEKENARTVGFIEQFREKNHAALIQLIKEKEPQHLPPPMDPQRAKEWWQWEMDRPGFTQRLGAEAEIAQVKLWKNAPGEVVLLSSSWAGDRGFLCPWVDEVEVTLPQKNWMGRSKPPVNRWFNFQKFLEAIPFLQKVGSPYDLWLLPFQFREKALEVLSTIPPLGRRPSGSLIPPGEFVDDPPVLTG